MPDRCSPIAVRVICGQATTFEEQLCLQELPRALPADIKAVREVLINEIGFVPSDPVGLGADDLRHLSVVDRSQLGGGKERTTQLPTTSHRLRIVEDRLSHACCGLIRRTHRRRWDDYGRP